MTNFGKTPESPLLRSLQVPNPGLSFNGISFLEKSLVSFGLIISLCKSLKKKELALLSARISFLPALNKALSNVRWKGCRSGARRLEIPRFSHLLYSFCPLTPPIHLPLSAPYNPPPFFTCAGRFQEYPPSTSPSDPGGTFSGRQTRQWVWPEDRRMEYSRGIKDLMDTFRAA